MNPEQIRKTADLLFAKAMEIKQGGNDLRPVLFGIAKDPTQQSLIFLPPEKEAWPSILQLLAPKADAILFVTEAWMARPKKNEVPMDIPVRDMPNAMDALIGVLYTLRGETLFTSILQDGIPGTPEILDGVRFPNGNLTNPYPLNLPQADA